MLQEVQEAYTALVEEIREDAAADDEEAPGVAGAADPLVCPLPCVRLPCNVQGLDPCR